MKFDRIYEGVSAGYEDIDAIVASDAPAFNGVQFDSKPAALRQLLIVSEVIESVESHANNAADRHTS